MAEQAGKTENEASEGLYLAAYEKYKLALFSKPNDYVPNYNWGSAIYSQAKKITDTDRKTKLYEEAAEKLMLAEKVRPGIATYNLACIAALLGKEESCKEWFKRCLMHNSLPSCERLCQDTDLKSVCGQKWFRKLLTALNNRTNIANQ